MEWFSDVTMSYFDNTHQQFGFCVVRCEAVSFQNGQNLSFGMVLEFSSTIETSKRSGVNNNKVLCHLAKSVSKK